jgi:CTP:molybdopterin cytidylyltransferase MocA
MTVAAIVLSPDTTTALADADGEPVIRRVAHAAWSGGALPIVIVSPDAAGSLAEAVADLPAALARPDAGTSPGIGWFVAGQRAALAGVAETTAALLWPFRYAWVDPETVTSLVEAHGVTPDAIVQPAYAGQAGFPILIPMALVDRLSERAALHGPEAVAALIAEGVPARLLELGDPGIVNDIGTTRAAMPPYQGPPRPATSPTPD